MLRLSAHNRNIPLVKRKRDAPGHFFLSAIHESVKRFAKRRKPQAEIDELSIFQAYMLLEMGHVTLQAKCLQLSMGRDQKRSARSLVTSTRLDSNKTVFDQVHTTDGVPSANFVEQLDQRYRIHSHPVHRDGNSAVEADSHLLLLI